mgnify:CR=1 FL=1
MTFQRRIRLQARYARICARAWGVSDDEALLRIMELPERWIEAYLNPECFYCGVELPLDEVTKEELPQERICEKCAAKEEAEIY